MGSHQLAIKRFKQREANQLLQIQLNNSNGHSVLSLLLHITCCSQVGGITGNTAVLNSPDPAAVAQFSWSSVADLPFSFLHTASGGTSGALPEALLPAIAACRLLQGPGFADGILTLLENLNWHVQEPWQNQNADVLANILAHALSCATEAAVTGQPSSTHTQLAAQAGNVATFLRQVAADPSSFFPLVSSLLSPVSRLPYLQFARLFQCNTTWADALLNSVAQAASNLPSFDHAKQVQQMALDIMEACKSGSSCDTLEHLLHPVLGNTNAWQSANPFWEAYIVWQQAAATSFQSGAVAVGLSMLMPIFGSSAPPAAVCLLQAMQSNTDAAWDTLPAQMVDSSVSKMLDDFLGSSPAAVWNAATILSGASAAHSASGLLRVCKAISCIRSEHASISLIAKSMTAPLALLGSSVSRLQKAITKVIEQPGYGIPKTVEHSHSILLALAKLEGMDRRKVQGLMTILVVGHDFLLTEAKDLTCSNVDSVLQQHPSLLSQLQSAPITVQEQLKKSLCEAAAAAKASDLSKALQEFGGIVLMTSGVNLTPQILAVALACRSARDVTTSPVSALTQGCNLAAKLADGRQAQRMHELQSAINTYFASAHGHLGGQWGAAHAACQLLVTISSADAAHQHGALARRLEKLMAHLRQTMDRSSLRDAIHEVTLALYLVTVTRTLWHQSYCFDADYLHLYHPYCCMLCADSCIPVLTYVHMCVCSAYILLSCSVRFHMPGMMDIWVKHHAYPSRPLAYDGIYSTAMSVHVRVVWSLTTCQCSCDAHSCFLRSFCAFRNPLG